jgi:adenine phosphoribosyltransferase
VLLIDDLLATGGTALAAVRLIERGAGTVVEFACIIELNFLKGRMRLKNRDVFSLVTFD